MGARPEADGLLTPDDRELLERLLQEQGARLLGYVRRTFGNHHDAEDIVAETFCRAAANIAAVRASTRPDLYLLTTARNLCRDGFRRQRPTPTTPDRLEHHTRPVGDPLRPLADDERKRQLQTAINELPEHLREVVVLRLSSDLKFEEIAALLHVPLGTALSRMHSAMKHLKRTLSPIHDA